MANQQLYWKLEVASLLQAHPVSQLAFIESRRSNFVGLATCSTVSSRSHLLADPFASYRKQSTGSKASFALFLSLYFYIMCYVSFLVVNLSPSFFQFSFKAPMFLSILEWHFSENNNNSIINYLITQWNFSSANSIMEQSLRAVLKV